MTWQEFEAGWTGNAKAKGKGKMKGKAKPGGGKGYGGGCSFRDVVKAIQQTGGLSEKWKNDENTVCIKNLPSDTSEDDVLTICAPVGRVAFGGVYLKGRGAIVNFLDAEGAA